MSVTMPKKPVIRLLVEVETPPRISKRKVAKLVEWLIDVGLQEAETRSGLPDFEDPDLEVILALEIHPPKVLK
jgi:hypothetical protein